MRPPMMSASQERHSSTHSIGSRRTSALVLLTAVLTGWIGASGLHAQDSSFVRGDCDGNGSLDVTDAIVTLQALFNGGAASCWDACDFNDDGQASVVDPIGLLAYIFTGGLEPTAPFPDCGPDPTTDALSCEGPVSACPAAGSAPTITSSAPTTATVGDPWSYDVMATDPDAGDNTTFSLTIAPTGATIDPVSGAAAWTPASAGSAPFTVRASDDSGLFTEQSFDVQVSPSGNQPPVAVDDVAYVAPGCAIERTANDGVLSNDSDPEGSQLIATLLSAPAFGVVTLEEDGAFEYTHGGGPETTDQFTYEVSDGASTSSATVTVTIGENPLRRLDHFEGTALSSEWTAVTSNGGAVVLPDNSVVQIDAPTSNATAFIHPTNPIDPSQSQTWMFCVRRIAGDGIPDVIGLWRTPAGTTPGAEPEATLDAQRLGAITLTQSGSTGSVRFQHDLAGNGTFRQWAGEPASEWSNPGTNASAITPIRVGSSADWIVVGLEIDADQGAFRFFNFHRLGFDIEDTSHGIVLNALTDWVPFSAAGGLGASDDLWLTVGDRHADTHDVEFEVEWVRWEGDEGLHGITNARGSISTEYTLRHFRNRGTQFFPDGRGDTIVTGGPSGSWYDEGIRKKNAIHASDGTYYLFYEGFDSNDDSSIGLATSSSPDGPWIPHPNNPVLPRTVLPNNGANYDIFTGPFVVEDLGEADPDRRWKLLATGEVLGTSTHRMFYFTAPAPDGPWTRQIGPAIDGAVLAESNLDDWQDRGVNDALVWWDDEAELWNLYYAGIRVKESEFAPGGWSVGHATSADFINWTENAANPVIQADSNGIRSWTSVSGNTITVSDASGFSEDAAVVIRNSGTLENWAISRIRRINGNQLELYHEINGVGGSASHRTVAQIGNGSLSPMILTREPDGCYRMYLTVFQPFILGSLSAGFGNCELVASMTAPTPLGPWTWDHLGNPCVPLDVWGAERAQENLRTIHQPTVR
ncbi:MAG: Ig-like domain-containing protein [Planctomycetota bacterium]